MARGWAESAAGDRRRWCFRRAGNAPRRFLHPLL